MHSSSDSSDAASGNDHSPQNHNGPEGNPNAAREKGKAKVPSGGQSEIDPNEGADIKQPGNDD
jgi:hypothetical protein